MSAEQRSIAFLRNPVMYHETEVSHDPSRYTFINLRPALYPNQLPDHPPSARLRSFTSSLYRSRPSKNEWIPSDPFMNQGDSSIPGVVRQPTVLARLLDSIHSITLDTSAFSPSQPLLAGRRADTTGGENPWQVLKKFINARLSTADACTIPTAETGEAGSPREPAFPSCLTIGNARYAEPGRRCFGLCEARDPPRNRNLDVHGLCRVVSYYRVSTYPSGQSVPGPDAVL